MFGCALLLLTLLTLLTDLVIEELLALLDLLAVLTTGALVREVGGGLETLVAHLLALLRTDELVGLVHETHWDVLSS